MLGLEELALPSEMRARRDAWEWEASRLRQQKATLPEADYYRQLEALLLQLARLQAPRTSQRTLGAP